MTKRQYAKFPIYALGAFHPVRVSFHLIARKIGKKKPQYVQSKIHYSITESYTVENLTVIVGQIYKSDGYFNQIQASGVKNLTFRLSTTVIQDFQ